MDLFILIPLGIVAFALYDVFIRKDDSPQTVIQEMDELDEPLFPMGYGQHNEFPYSGCSLFTMDDED